MKKTAKKLTQIEPLNLPYSEASLTRELRAGVSSNFVQYFQVVEDEGTLDFCKLSLVDSKPQKDLVSRVTLSMSQIKALHSLLGKQIKNQKKK